VRRFGKASVMAVAFTALLLMVWGDPEAAGRDSVIQPEAANDAAAVVAEATGTIRELLSSFYGLLPRLGLVLILLACAWAVRRLVQRGVRRMFGHWQQQAAAHAVVSLIIYLATTVAVVSVLAGDVRAMIGSVGLLGLAASWALQTPIESFSGWLLNAFRGYYRVGDRIAVGDVFGDVYRIDMLTTMVWEAGGPDKSVRAAQATGALITFPNWEVLRSNIVNYTRDFPYVWDEVTFTIANESDLAYAAEVIESTARDLLGAEMVDATRKYDELLQQQHLAFEVEQVPRVYLSLADAWTNCTLRYLVPVRTRRGWASRLVIRISAELSNPVHAPRIISAYPRTEVLLRRDWSAATEQAE
jgi:small conductance mechanosensitive channel